MKIDSKKLITLLADKKAVLLDIRFKEETDAWRMGFGQFIPFTKRGPKPEDPSASPERLYSEIGRLKMELDWLKKSPGSASRGPQTLGKSA